MPSPHNYQEAISGPHSAEWAAALQHELKSLAERNWCTICSETDQKDPSKRGIKSKLCFKIKVNPDKTFKFKVRLVACGYSQRYGRDFMRTFWPTVHWKSICTVLHLAAVFDWEITGFDVQNAFVEGQLEEDIYMFLPKEVSTNPDGSQVKVKLNKSLYGLKQAGFVWNTKLVKDLLSIGFKQSIYDKCVFVYTD